MYSTSATIGRTYAPSVLSVLIRSIPWAASRRNRCLTGAGERSRTSTVDAGTVTTAKPANPGSHPASSVTCRRSSRGGARNDAGNPPG